MSGDEKKQDRDKRIDPRIPGLPGLSLAIRFEGGVIPWKDLAVEEEVRPRLIADFTGRQGELVFGGTVLADIRVVERGRGKAFAEISGTNTALTEEYLCGLLLDTPLPVTVEIGRTTMELSDVEKLRPGSVINFDVPIDALLNLYVDGIASPVAFGKAFQVDDNLGIIITRLNRFTDVADGMKVKKVDYLPALNLRLILGTKKLTYREITGISLDMVLELDQPAAEPVKVMLDNGTGFSGEIMVVNECFAVKLVGGTGMPPGGFEEKEQAGMEIKPPACLEETHLETEKSLLGDAIGKAAGELLLEVLRPEHPQIIAAVLSLMDSYKASCVLSGLPVEIQTEVTQRLAALDKISPAVLRILEKALVPRLSLAETGASCRFSGIDTLVRILQFMDSPSQKALMAGIATTDHLLADKIKKRVFLFEDLLKLDDRAVQKMLREVDTSVLAMALKGASGDIQDKIFRNMSKRAAVILKEDMAFIGPARLSDVEEMQSRIVNIVRKLEEQGEIIIVRDDEDKLVL
ncbi:MAG: flagellar motor switch protein FliG [Spirochaetales bacterium]|nr:flagellar motor switch protein FliG [Spirochaetales bacterium]